MSQVRSVTYVSGLERAGNSPSSLSLRCFAGHAGGTREPPTPSLRSANSPCSWNIYLFRRVRGKWRPDASPAELGRSIAETCGV